jgi:hypothetical protein
MTQKRLRQRGFGAKTLVRGEMDCPPF